MENNITRTIIYAGQQPTEEQIHEIELASLNPVVPDEDAPELTMEQYAEMTAIAKKRTKPVLLRCHAIPFSKFTIKITVIFIAHLTDDVLHRKLRFQNICYRLLKPFPHQKFLKRASRYVIVMLTKIRKYIMFQINRASLSAPPPLSPGHPPVRHKSDRSISTRFP